MTNKTKAREFWILPLTFDGSFYKALDGSKDSRSGIKVREVLSDSSTLQESVFQAVVNYLNSEDTGFVSDVLKSVATRLQQNKQLIMSNAEKIRKGKEGK